MPADLYTTWCIRTHYCVSTAWTVDVPADLYTTWSIRTHYCVGTAWTVDVVSDHLLVAIIMRSVTVAMLHNIAL